jgi:hypothetical protein
MSFGFFVTSTKTVEINIKNGSEVVIDGKSNVNRFNCEYTTVISQGTKEITYNIFDDTYLLKNASLKLDTKAFDCGGRMINKDFNKLMQTDDHPNILIKLHHIKAKNDTFKITADIHIAGKKNTYIFEMCHNEGDNYTGALSLNIEDFDMEAPHKLLGAIKVHPEIDINFDLDMTISQAK